MAEIIKCVVVEDFEPLNNIYANLIDYEKDMKVAGRAYDSEELFKILKATNVDLILLDIEMKSRTEGLNACRIISCQYPDVKVVILTCHDEEDMILSAFEAGAVDYVLKTASSTQILETVRSAYNNSSSINSYPASVIRKRMKEFSTFKEKLLGLMNVITILTVSEIDILRLLIQGKKQRDIAEIRSVELVTVKAHTSNILKKFNAKKTADVVKMVKGTGLESFVENMYSKQ